ncbi:hypothetical protein ABBQ32_003182 [Trebouxia sp. C0010 RCD-2024]
MAGQASVVPDLTSDNFDLLRFPSLTAFAHELQTDNDDLSMIARLGSLFDPLTKPAFPASVSPPTSASEAAQPAEQVCQPSPQHMDAGIQLTHTPRAQQPMPFSANSPGYPMLSPRSPRPNPAQMVPRPLMAMQTPFALPAQTSFESERSQHHFQSASAQEGLDSEFSEEDLSDPERAVTPRRSSRKRNVTQASKDGDDQNWMKPKKKVGRPITYNGDPNAPELSEAERRKVKRRIANRESARRVQQRRKEMIDELQHKLIYIQHHQHHLMQHLSKLELEKGQLYGQLTDMKQKYASCSTENVRLQAQVQALQQQFDQRQQHGVGQAGFHAGGQGQGLPAAQ